MVVLSMAKLGPTIKLFFHVIRNDIISTWFIFSIQDGHHKISFTYFIHLLVANLFLWFSLVVMIFIKYR